jgi:O-acetyl-ADP-ribose deacetylase (regulator of RNase III)
MIEIHADLLDSELPAIGHGVNLRGVMGAGIAGQILKVVSWFQVGTPSLKQRTNSSTTSLRRSSLEQTHLWIS